ncbi:MAG: carbohydrate kinase [Lewinellaceae bacterium]|nr:carbohydrate kinase [Lewinellaceae bacterium]
MPSPQVICFGEVLWDLLPSGPVAGGAPMNVAFHLNQLGVPAGMVSRVGADELGVELLDFLRAKRIPTDLIQTDPEYPTGTVKVTLDAGGHPSYEIVQPSAWDHITPEPAAESAIRKAEMLVYGSLVCRNSASDHALHQYIAQAKYRVFDVNLRQPFFSEKLIRELLLTANLVKMNDDELNIIADWLYLPGDAAQRMAALFVRFDLDGLIVTRGEHGAAFFDKNGYIETPGERVIVQDTIGSGDAFLAGFLSQKLKNAAPGTCLEFAGQLGAFVATQKGGTPEHKM